MPKAKQTIQTNNPKDSSDQQTLEIRNATIPDVPALRKFVTRVYREAGIAGYTEGALTGQITFPMGRFWSLTEAE